MAEILLQTTLLLAVYFLLFYLKKKKVRFLLFLNIALSCALLIKPILFYFWLPNMIFHIGLFIRNRRRLSILFLPLFFVVTLLAWNYRNYHHTGYFHFSSIKNYNLLHCNTYLFLIETQGENKAKEFVSSVEEEVVQMDFAEANRTIEKRCLAVIRADWPGYTLFQLRGSLFFFLDPGRFDAYHFLGKAQPPSSFLILSRAGIEGFIQFVKTIPDSIFLFLLFTMAINILLFFLFFISLFKRTNIIDMKLFLLLVIVFFIVMVGPFGASRFRIVIFPTLLIFIAMGFPNRQNLRLS